MRRLPPNVSSLNGSVMHNSISTSIDGVRAFRPAKSSTRQRLRGDYAITAVCVLVLTFAAMWWNERVTHWFVLPLMLCGILAGVDVVRWLRGNLDLFDPRTVIACLAFYGLFVAPLLHVIWDSFGVGNDLILSGDWRPWLGAMAGLNVVGLVAYRAAHNSVFNRARESAMRWEIDSKRFYPVFAFVLVLSIAGMLAFLWQLGGVSGIVESLENNREAFVGKGWLLIFAWPLAVLSFIVVVFTSTDSQRNKRWGLTVGLLLMSVAGITHFLLMGWHGSRSATIWALFWMAGIVHYRFRKLSPGLVTAGVIFLIAFMYFYGFYKEQKRAAFEVLRTPSMWLEPKGYQRDIKYLLLGDLARADSSACILHNLIKDPGDYNLRWGLTYAGAFTILIPKKLWPDRPEFKVEAGTDMLLGKTSPWPSSRVYGLIGEAMLNFGPLGVVPMFAIYGGLLGWYRRKMHTWSAQDARLFLAPFITMLLAAGLMSDSDNIVAAALTEGMLVFAAIFAASRRSPAS
jgi:hypothetical protein